MRKRPLSWALLAASSALAAFGVWAGEASALWQKAVSVCLSCIGIG
ncbi:MAG: hypothetical protein K6360_01750 [Deltaproteobacteria bacterium]